MSSENSVDNCEANLFGVPVATPEHDNNDLDNDGNFLDNALSSSNAYVTQILGEEHHQISLSGEMGETQVNDLNVSSPIATQQLQSIDEHHQMSSSALSDETQAGGHMIAPSTIITQQSESIEEHQYIGETQVGSDLIAPPIIIQQSQSVDVNNIMQMFDAIILASPALIQHGYGGELARRWAAVGNTLNCFNCDLSQYMALLSTSSHPNTPSPFFNQSTSSIFTHDSSVASGSLMSTLTPLSSRRVSIPTIPESATTSASFEKATKPSRCKSLQTIHQCHQQPNGSHVVQISDDEEEQPQKRKRAVYASWSFALVKELVDLYKATDTTLSKMERVKAVQQNLDPTHPLAKMSPNSIRCKLQSLAEL